MTKLEAWQAWCAAGGTEQLADQLTLMKSSHGKAFSYAWDAAQRAEQNRVWTQEHWTEYERSIVEAEREACAKVCDVGVDTEHPTVKGHIMKNFGASSTLAAAIRARGQQ